MDRVLVVLMTLGSTVGSHVGRASHLTPCWRGKPGSTYQEWRFDTRANPAAPDFSSDPAPGSQAVIVPGQFSAGWQNMLAGFGTRQGYWDLGREGTITVDVPQDADASPGAYQYISVQVSQWHDGFIYGQFAAVSIDGATFVGNEQQTVETTSLGAWVIDQSLWRVVPKRDAEAIVIRGAHNGSVVDQVIVETRSFERCQGDHVVSADPGTCKATVSYALPYVDNCFVAGTASCTPPPGSMFMVGTTTVTCTTTDVYGQTATCTFAVTVLDPEPARLQIRRVDNNRVEISWPVGCGSSTLETNADLTNPQGWAPVQDQAQIEAGRYKITVETVDPYRWFRVRKP